MLTIEIPTDALIDSEDAGAQLADLLHTVANRVAEAICIVGVNAEWQPEVRRVARRSPDGTLLGAVFTLDTDTAARQTSGVPG